MYFQPTVTNLFSMRNLFSPTPRVGNFLTPRFGQRSTVETADNEHHAGRKLDVTSTPTPSHHSHNLTPIAGEEHAASAENLKGSKEYSTSHDLAPQAPSKYSAVGKSVPVGALLSPRGLMSPTAESRSAVEIEVDYAEFAFTPRCESDKLSVQQPQNHLVVSKNGTNSSDSESATESKAMTKSPDSGYVE